MPQLLDADANVGRLRLLRLNEASSRQSPTSCGSRYPTSRRTVRVAWDAFDVLWGDIRIKVKTSALVQRWAQCQPSTLAF